MGGGVDTRHGASGLPTVPSTYRGDISYYLSGSGNVVWVDGHVTARRSSVEINDVVKWRHLWDPLQGVGGWQDRIGAPWRGAERPMPRCCLFVRLMHGGPSGCGMGWTRPDWCNSLLCPA